MTTLDPRAIPAALFGGRAETRTALSRWDAAVRTPVATGRRIGFVQLAPGVGATTLARHVTRIAATRRAAPVLAVDVAGAEGGLAARLRAGTTPPSDARAFARTSADAQTGLARGTEGQFVLHPGRPAAEAVEAWLAEAAPIARFFDVAVTDFGPRHPTVDFAACAALCDVVCIVSRADRADGELSSSLAAAVRDLPESPAVVLALVDLDRTAGEAPRVVAAHAPAPVVVVPHDSGLARDASPRGLGARAALLELTASLISHRSVAVEGARA